MSWRGRLWTWLGGTVDPTGEPTLDDDDRRIVFEGSHEDAVLVHGVLQEEDMASEVHTFVDQRGRHSIAWARVSVPGGEAVVAGDVVASIPVVDNGLDPDRRASPALIDPEEDDGDDRLPASEDHDRGPEDQPG